MRLTVCPSPLARAGPDDPTFRLIGGASSSRDHSPWRLSHARFDGVGSSSRIRGAPGRLAPIYISATDREARVRGYLIGHDRLTSTILPAGCTIKPPDTGSRQCLWVIALLTEQLASRSSGSWPKLTPIGQHAWRDTNRSSGACSNAWGRMDGNRSATRNPDLQIRSRILAVQAGP